jgi:outer membrane receptor for ferrienterochelin and colicins
VKSVYCSGLLWLLMTASVHAEEVIRADAVSVAGERDETQLRKDAGTQKVVFGHKEIENLSVMTVGEVMNKLPGVEISGTGQRARGMSRDSIQILVDGERLPGSAMGSYARLPSSELERVEIHRGASAEHGSSSPLTINLVLKKALPKRSTEMKAGIGLKDGDPNYQLAWTETGGEGNFAWSLPVSLNFSKSPIKSFVDRRGVNWQQEFTDGTSEMGHYAITPRFTWKSGRDNLSLSTMMFFGPSEQRTTADLFGSTTGLRISEQESDYQAIRLRLQGEKYFGESKLSGHLSANNRDTSTDISRLTTGQTNIVEKTRGVENELNTAVRWDQPIGLHYVSLGAEYIQLWRTDKQRFNDVSGQSVFDTSSTDRVLWLQDAWTPQEAVTLTSGLRLENMYLQSDSNDQTRVGILPSVALKWQPDEAWVMRTSLGVGMKMPKLNEISNSVTRSAVFNTNSTPISANQAGNPNLKPEHSINFEAVLERYLANKMGVLSANFYARSTQDFTERRVALEGTAWVDRPYNVGDALHWGFELDGKIQTDPWAWSGGTLKAHLTLPHAKVQDDFLGITRMAKDTPKYVMSMGWDQSVPKWQSNFGLNLQLSGRSETDVPGEQKAYTEARALLDAFWLYKVSPKFNLRVAAQNILDEDTRLRNRYFTQAQDYQLISNDYGFRTLMVTLEGRW